MTPSASKKEKLQVFLQVHWRSDDDNIAEICPAIEHIKIELVQLFACSHPPQLVSSGQFPAEARRQRKCSSIYRLQSKASEMKQVVVLCVAACLVSLAFSAAIPGHERPLDPDHVPSSVCEDMVPVHNDSKPSTEPAPYTITPSKTKVSPGEVIKVVVTGKNGEDYKGLYMQVRLVEAGSEAVGKFTTSNIKVSPAIRISTCPPGTENAISYVSRTPVETLTLEWKAPENFSGTVYFRATILESFAKFWVGVSSDAVSVE